MNLAREIKKDIYWIGVNDRRTHIFENYWPLPKGVAYNSYIIVDEKVVVIDTIERSKMDDYVENIEQLLNGRKVDYLVINHMEPDHTGAIKALLCHYPDVKIIGNAKTFPMLKNFYGVCENLMEVKEGDSLDLGKHKLNFYMHRCCTGRKRWLLSNQPKVSCSVVTSSERSEHLTVASLMTRLTWITWKRKSVATIPILLENTVNRLKLH